MSKQERLHEYDLFLPLRYNDGSPVETEKIEQLKKTLRDRFGGLTYFPQKIQGAWKLGQVTCTDELVILRVLTAQRDQARTFFARLKQELKASLRQDDLLILERKIRAL